MIKKIILLILSVTAVFTFAILQRDAEQGIGTDDIVAPYISASDEPSLRDWNVTQDILANGDRVANISTGWKNYLTDTGFEPIDTTPAQNGEFFEITKAPFVGRAPLYADGQAEMINNNKLEVKIGADKVEKTRIEEAPVTQYSTPLQVSHILGNVQSVNYGFGETASVVYEGAYPYADLIYAVHQGEEPTWRRIIRFNEDPRGKTGYTGEICFDISYDKNMRLVRPNKVGWGEASGLRTKGHLDGEVRNSTKRGISFLPFEIWDSNIGFDRKREQIFVELTSRVKNREYTLCKQIPSTFFDDAVFPVFTDDTATFNSAAGANSPVDGHVYKNDSTSWATTRGATGGSGATAVATSDSYPLVGKDGSNFIIGRTFYLFDTSTIGAGATVTSSSLALAATTPVYNADNDGDDYIVITSSNPAVTNSLATDDFEQLGTTAYSNTIDIGSIVTGNAYNYFNLNASGLAAITTTSTTKLGGREGHDMIDSAFAGADNTFSGVNFYFADQTGTSLDPVLTVVYTPAAAATNQFRAGYYIQF